MLLAIAVAVTPELMMQVMLRTMMIKSIMNILDKLSKVNTKCKSKEKIKIPSLDKLSKVNTNSKSNRKIKASRRNLKVNATPSFCKSNISTNAATSNNTTKQSYTNQSGKSNVETNAHNNTVPRSSLHRIFSSFSTYVSDAYNHWFNDDERHNYHVNLLKKALRKNNRHAKTRNNEISK